MHTRHPGVMVWGLPTSLSSFLTRLFTLTAQDCNDTDTDTDVGNSDHDDKQSNICKTSLIVFGLTSAVVVMSYTVLLAAYAVVNFT